MEEPTIEVRYAGTVVAKSAPARDQDANGFFLSVGEPMPVGTVLQLTVDQVTKYGRVEQVVESTESMQAGMRIRFVAAPVARPAPLAVAPAPVAVAVAPAPAVSEASAPVMPASIVDSAATTTGAADDDAGGGDGEAAATPGGNGADPNPGQGGGGRRRRRRR